MAVTEADLESYAGLYLARSAEFPMKLVGVFPAYPAKEEARNDRNIVVTARQPYLAKTAGTRSFPWRVLMIAGRDGDLIESTARSTGWPSPPAATSAWVKPGKVAWDWWNDLNISGVDFRAGVNTETYKYYIDFAAENGIEYVILDEGWYKLGDLLTVKPDIDMPAIVAYGKSQERRDHPLGGLEDARQPVRRGHGPVQPLGHPGAQGRLHAAGRPAGWSTSTTRSRPRRPSGISWSTSTAPTSPPASTGPSPTC